MFFSYEIPDFTKIRFLAMLIVLSHFRLEEPPLVRPVLSPNRDQLAKGELNSSLPSPIRAYIHLAVRRLVTKSHEKTRDLYWDMSGCSEIWRTSRQQCCWDTCRILEWYDHFKHLISWLRGCARSIGKTFHRLVKRCPGALLQRVFNSFRPSDAYMRQ